MRGDRSAGMDRRWFLQLGAAAVAGVLVSGCAPGELGSSDVDLSVPALLPALGSDIVLDIGRRYRSAYPDEGTAPRLRAAIAAAHRSNGKPGWRSQDVAEQVQADFAAARTVVVNGWVLSVTEARQCALYSIPRG